MSLDTQEKVHTRLQDLLEQEQTRRDVETAIELQERELYSDEVFLAQHLEKRLGWNFNHAREIAELAWTELYAEKEGADNG